MRFLRHGGIYRSDVSSLLVPPGRGSRFPVGPVPGYRTSRKEHALPIVRDEFRPAIPRWGARQHCPSPLHRHHQLKSIAVSDGIIYHRTADSLLTVCLTHRDNPREAPPAGNAASPGDQSMNVKVTCEVYDVLRACVSGFSPNNRLVVSMSRSAETGLGNVASAPNKRALRAAGSINGKRVGRRTNRGVAENAGNVPVMATIFIPGCM